MRSRVHSCRPAFSLIELMIAIMILGLGMVMVATVFPVSLSLTRDAIQINVMPTVVDSAVSTLRLRMPGENEGMVAPNAPPLQPWVVMPEAVSSPVGLNLNGVEQDAVINLPGEWPAAYPSFLTVASPLGRSYTEESSWDAEAQPPLVPPTGTAPVATCFAIDSQNIRAYPADPNLPVAMERPPFINQRLGMPLPSAFSQPNEQFLTGRIHIGDRVYPPVQIPMSGTNYLNPATGAAFTNPDQLNYYAAQVAANGMPDLRELPRRYSWSAFAQKSLTYNSTGRFNCTIAITMRTDLEARFGKQLCDLTNGFDFTTPGGLPSGATLALLQDPKLAVADYDTVFPQPWLVSFDIDTNTGTILCTPMVSSMLPAESYFIVAQGKTTDFLAGSHFKIRAHGPAYPQMDPLGKGLVQGVVAWVFPPPLVPGRKTFGTKSPVVGVFVQEIKPL